MSIRIEPVELRFPFALNTATVQKLRILAVGASTTFKIKTTNPKRYSVRPNLGVAWMGAAAEVTVQLGAFKELPGDLAKCKDKFQVLSLVLSDEHCQQLEALGPEERRGMLNELWAAEEAQAATAEATSTAVSTAEVAKLFGRFAEKVLHLDRDVGACCHSACSDCEWRTPDGGYRWDVMKAMQPKWVGCYRERDFEDQRGCHAPKWATTLFAESDDIGRDEFVARLRGMEYAEAMS